MKHPVVVGLQYGDEGKGKLTDFLAREADWVIRFNGGSNAGHTLLVNGKKIVTHSVPSGILYDKCKNFIGAGCVLEPKAFFKELNDLHASGLSTEGRLWVHHRTHITFPLHLALEALRESGDNKVGTTRKGIGPTYSVKMNRMGVRAGDLVSGQWQERLRDLFETYKPLFEGLDLPETQWGFNFSFGQQISVQLKPYVVFEDTPFYEVARKQKCVLEGAQAVLLDIDYGTYPFVTSSNTLGSYAPVGAPFPYSCLGASIGVAKSYMTRVGEGPFETELPADKADELRVRGGEFGATTGRPRRVGWLNADELKYAIRVSDCQYIFMTKADVLCGEKTVYALFNKELKSFDGWDYVEKNGKIHPAFEAYLRAIELHVGVPVIGVGTGPERKQTVWRHKIDFWS